MVSLSTENLQIGYGDKTIVEELEFTDKQRGNYYDYRSQWLREIDDFKNISTCPFGQIWNHLFRWEDDSQSSNKGNC